MYIKYGRILNAQKLFDNMHDVNIVTWIIMIKGHVIHNYTNYSLKLFNLMKHLGTNPNNMTIFCVLLAFSHAGLLDEGCK